MKWLNVKVKHLCTDAGQYGLNVSAEHYVESGVRLIRTSDITESGKLKPPVDGVYVNAVLEDRHALRPGDLLLSRSGSLGRALMIPESMHTATYAGYLVRFRPHCGVDPRFLSYVAFSNPFQDAIKADAVSSTIQNFNAERYANIQVLAPPLEEQRCIADFLDVELARIDSVANEQSKARSVLAERRLALVQYLLTGAHCTARQPSSLTWVDLLPVNWTETKINFVARMGSGHTPSRSTPEWWIDCTVPWVTTGEVSLIRDDRREEILETREMISLVGMANSSAKLHPAGTVVLSRTASAGFSAVMGRDMATSQDFVTWTCGPKLDPYYLLWCLRAMRGDLLGRLAMGSTHKTIYVPDLQTLRIPLPPISEQRDIVAKIRTSNAEVDKLVDLIDRQQELLVERRQALITAAVTGQIDVTTARGVEL